jgi:hypothetical protein
VTRIPHESSEVRLFTPASLANLPSPPTFLFKPATRRERRLHGRMIMEAGLQHHSQPAVRDEIIRALHAGWSPDLVAGQEPRLLAYWAALDEHISAQAKVPFEERIAFTHPDDEPVALLNEQVVNAWSPLRRMAADNSAFSNESPILMACCIIIGWEHVDVSFALEAGAVPIERMEDVGEWLKSIEKKHFGKIEGIGVPGMAFTELCLEAANSLYLTEEERKNSASLSPSSSTQSSSSGVTASSSSTESDTKAEQAN